MTIVPQVMTAGNVGVHSSFWLLLIFPSDLACLAASHWYCIIFLINSFFFLFSFLWQPESALCFHRGIVKDLQMIKLKLRKSCDIIHTVKKLVKLENWDSSLKLKPYISDLDLNPLAGIQTQSKPCLGPKPTWLGLKPSQNPAWDLNQRVWDSNPAKIHGIWFLDLMKIRFLMSHRWKNSVRDKVIGKKWIYSDTERSIPHRAWGITEGEHGCEMWHG